MKDICLVRPDKKYKLSFENYALAYKRINDEHYFEKYKGALDNFQLYLIELHNYHEGKNIAQGKVGTSTFWLIVKEEVVGVVRIRHQAVDSAGHIGYDIGPDYRNRGYGSQILNLALEKAKELGIEEAILTCNINNFASRKIIERNQGKQLGIIFDEEDREHLYKYAISLNT